MDGAMLGSGWGKAIWIVVAAIRNRDGGYKYSVGTDTGTVWEQIQVHIRDQERVGIRLQVRLRVYTHGYGYGHCRLWSKTLKLLLSTASRCASKKA